MTQDEMIEMARRAGVRDDGYIFEFSEYKYLDRFANLVAQHERDACAKVCDEYDDKRYANSADLCANAIRARSNT